MGPIHSLLPLLALQAADGHGKPMEIIDHLTPNATLGVQIVIFLVLIVILNSLLFKPLVALLEAREKGTKGTEGGARHLLKEAEERTALIEKKIAEARIQGQDIVRQWRSEALAADAAQRHDARAEAEKKIETFRASFHAEAVKARKEALGSARDLAAQLATKILGRTVN